MGLLYKIAKWSVNKLIKKGVDLTDLVETDEHTQKIREVAHRLNDDMVMLQNDFSIKRAEIIELQSQLIQAVEPVYITMLAESKDSMIQTTMTKHWIDKLDEIKTYFKVIKGYLRFVSKIRTQSYSRNNFLKQVYHLLLETKQKQLIPHSRPIQEIILLKICLSWVN